MPIAGSLWAGLGACREPAPADPHRSPPDSSSSGTAAAPDAPASSSDDSTTLQSLDTDPHAPEFPSPDCSASLLPGHPADIAATPRSDHDAEVLALLVDPAQAVATQARYDTVAADLAAIRALDPTLTTVHVGCVAPNGIAFWFYDDEDVNRAIHADAYGAWDCINARYHLLEIVRIDAVAVALELDGVYGSAVWEAYAGLPGLGDQQPHWFQRADWPVPPITGSRCTARSGSITLVASALPTGALDEREYHFVRETGEQVVYRVTPTEPPQPVG